jgi:Tol biopolymer transport system component
VKRVLGLLGAAGVLAIWGSAGAAAAGTGATAGLAYETGGTTGRSKVVIANGNGGDPRALASGGIPSLAPNGRAVAFNTESGKVGLYVYSAAGKLTGKFFSTKQVEVNQITWSHDSRYIAVALTDVNATTTIGKSGLAIVDTDTGTATTVAHGQVSGISWAPATDTLVFGLTKSGNQIGSYNLYKFSPGASSPSAVTSDNRSFNPVWGKLGIAYDSFRNRKGYAPVFEIWLMNGAGHSTQITHTKPGLLVDGLVPLSVSANGQRMIAAFEGEDTYEAYAVNLQSHAASLVKVSGGYPTPFGISKNGKRLLIDVGGFMNPPNDGKVASLPFGGGTPTILSAHGDFPSWNQ